MVVLQVYMTTTMITHILFNHKGLEHHTHLKQTSGSIWLWFVFRVYECDFCFGCIWLWFLFWMYMTVIFALDVYDCDFVLDVYDCDFCFGCIWLWFLFWMYMTVIFVLDVYDYDFCFGCFSIWLWFLFWMYITVIIVLLMHHHILHK